MPCVWVIKRFDNPVNVDDNNWRRGEIVYIHPGSTLPPTCTEADKSLFLHYYMTDKEKEEVLEYLARWNREIIFEVVAGPDPSGFRRIKSSNQKINQSETTGVWTQEIADNITAEWNSRYPTANLATVGFTAKDLLQEGTFTTGQAAEYQALVHELGEDTTDRQRIWYLTESACQAFESTGGEKTGTAQQLGPFLEYGVDS